MKVINKLKEIIIKYKAYLMIVIVVLISAFSIVYQNYKDKSKLYINNNEIEVNKYENKIAVYITGEVNSPGVYYVDSEYRLNDLVNLCGGLTENADVTDINLAEKLNDSDKIDIPKKTKNVYESTDNDEISDENNGLININKASKEELKSLNGIGETLANNIIEYRKNTKFEIVEDILNVNGIGNSKYEAIKEYICVK